MTKHGVGLLQLCSTSSHAIQRHTCSFGHQCHFCLCVGDEFMQRWIQQTDCHWIAIHDSEQFRDVLPLHDQQLVQGLSSISLISGQDHLPHGYDSLSFEEHVLSADKTNALGTEFLGLSSISRRLGIGSDLHVTDFICPLHDDSERSGELWWHCGNLSHHHFSRASIDGQDLSLSHSHRAHRELGSGIVNRDATSTSHAWSAHSTSNHCSMTGHATSGGQNSFCCVQTVDVIWAGLDTHQDHLLAIFAASHCFICGEDNLATRCTGRGRKALGNDLLLGLGVQSRVQELVNQIWLQTQKSLRLGDQAFLGHVNSNLQGSRSCSLAIAGLQHVELALLDGKLDILHVLVVSLELTAH
mmetsp:Transcript_65885/g.104524  ORF Transcript_65885/g.104524 Transcript_65885/m.104524 type:complete len:356 (-) Transcript_65885:94-1161(-)